MKRIFLILFLVSNAAFSQNSALSDGYQRLATNVGGKTELKRIIEQEMSYPAKALKEEKGGTVQIGYTVNRDSSVSNVKVTQSVSPELDAEALRIFRKVQWIPALERDKLVTLDSFMEIDFNPKKYSKYCKKRGFDTPPYSSSLDTNTKIYVRADSMPAFVGGNEALQNFIQKNLVYPKQAQLANIAGKVLLGFIVEPDGLVTNIRIVQSVGSGCDQEAMRLLEMMRWKPGKEKGKLVRVQMKMPFSFQLSNKFNENHSQ